MWYILKQLLTSVLVKMVDIYRATNINHYSPPLSTIIVNWCSNTYSAKVHTINFLLSLPLKYPLPSFLEPKNYLAPAAPPPPPPPPLPPTPPLLFLYNNSNSTVIHDGLYYQYMFTLPIQARIHIQYLRA